MFPIPTNLYLTDPRVTRRLIISALFAFCVLFIAVDVKTAPEPVFANGQMVRMKAFDVTGMVAGGYCVRSGCSYYLRTGPNATILVREFEIEAY